MGEVKTTITYDQIKAMKPCYEPEEIGINPGYEATIPEFIQEYRAKVENPEDIIWVLCRKQYMSERDMRLFAVWCARKALDLVDTLDPCSIRACDVAEQYALGNASYEELSAARATARAAAWDAARAAAWAAAWDAARDAAWAAAWAAARDAARDAQIDQLLTYFTYKKED